MIMYVMTFLDAMIVIGPAVTLVYSIWQVQTRVGVIYLLRRNVSARWFLAIQIIMLFIGVVAALFYPLPDQSYYLERALLTRIPFMIVNYGIMSLSVARTRMEPRRRSAKQRLEI